MHRPLTTGISDVGLGSDLFSLDSGRAGRLSSRKVSQLVLTPFSVENVKQGLIKTTGATDCFILDFETPPSILGWEGNPSAYTWFPADGLGLFPLDMGYSALRLSSACLRLRSSQKPVPRVKPRRPEHATLLASSRG